MAGGRRLAAQGAGRCLPMAPLSLRSTSRHGPNAAYLRCAASGEEGCGGDQSAVSQAQKCYCVLLYFVLLQTLVDICESSKFLRKKNYSCRIFQNVCFSLKRSLLFQTNDLCSRISVTSTYMKMYLHRQLVVCVFNIYEYCPNTAEVFKSLLRL